LIQVSASFLSANYSINEKESKQIFCEFVINTLGAAITGCKQTQGKLFFYDTEAQIVREGAIKGNRKCVYIRFFDGMLAEKVYIRYNKNGVKVVEIRNNILKS